MLKVILQDPGCQRRTHLSVWLNSAHHFSAAHDLGARQSSNLRRQYEINFHLRIRLQRFISLEKQTRTADIFGCAHVPVRFA